MVYCVYKILKCTVNIIFALDPKKDPITRGFELGLKVRHRARHYAPAALPCRYLNAATGRVDDGRELRLLLTPGRPLPPRCAVLAPWPVSLAPMVVSVVCRWCRWCGAGVECGGPGGVGPAGLLHPRRLPRLLLGARLPQAVH